MIFIILKVILWLSIMLREEGFWGLMFISAGRMHKVELKNEKKTRNEFYIFSIFVLL
jgi:hypothetical protein